MGIRERYEQHHKVTITRRGGEGRRRPVDPLHHRPPPAGQGDRPHRRGRVSRVRLRHASAPPALREAQKDLERITKEKDAAINNQEYEEAATLREAEATARETRRHARAPSGSRQVVGRPADGRRGGDRPGRRDVDRHPGHPHRPGGVRAAAPHGGGPPQPGHRPGGGDRDRLARPSAAPAPGSRTRSGRSARSSSSAPPASGRPSSPRRSPSSCSAARTRSSRST